MADDSVPDYRGYLFIPQPVVVYKMRRWVECPFGTLFGPHQCNWVFTTIPNIDAIAASVRRSPVHICNYIRSRLCHTGAMVRPDCYYDFFKRRAVIADPATPMSNEDFHGKKYTVEEVRSWISDFVDHFVVCPRCHELYTRMNEETFDVKCESCNYDYSFLRPVNSTSSIIHTMGYDDGMMF
jgi:translation initiation factor 2 beta subunit (eIF-2beta)/eIF-5